MKAELIFSFRINYYKYKIKSNSQKVSLRRRIFRLKDRDFNYDMLDLAARIENKS